MSTEITWNPQEGAEREVLFLRLETEGILLLPAKMMPVSNWLTTHWTLCIVHVKEFIDYTKLPKDQLFLHGIYYCIIWSRITEAQKKKRDYHVSYQNQNIWTVLTWLAENDNIRYAIMTQLIDCNRYLWQESFYMQIR